MTLTPSDMLPLRLNPQSPTSCRIHAKGPPDQSRARRALRATVVFCFVFMIIEGTIGFLAHSLAVLTDAAHMLTDVGALALALMSIHAFSWGATERYTYGWQRAEVLGALGSVFTIWALVGGIMIEAVSRIIDDVKCAQDVEKADCDGIDAKLMLMIGCIGFAVNIICALILHWGGHHGHSHGGSGGHGHTHGKSEGHAHSSEMAQVSGGGDHNHGHTHGEHDHSGHEHSHGDDHGHDHSHGGHDHGAEESHEKEHENVNIRGAFLHVLGDCLQSVGVIIAAGIIWGFNESRYGTNNYAHSWYNLADPFCSILFGIITLYTTMSLFRELFGVLMEGTPLGMNYNEILWALQQIDGVDGVHELHIWSLTTTAAALSVHLRAAAHTAVLEKAESVCRTFGIEHSTIQVDPVGNDGQFLACGNLASCPPNGQTQTSATTAVSII